MAIPLDQARGQRRSGAIKTVKTTVNLPDAMFRQLKVSAESRGDTFTQALKEAISLKIYVDEALAAGGKLLLELSDRSIREIVFAFPAESLASVGIEEPGPDAEHRENGAAPA